MKQDRYNTPPPPKGLKGRFLVVGEMVAWGDLFDVSFKTEPAGSRWQRCHISLFECPETYWFYRPYYEYLVDDDERYLAPLENEFDNRTSDEKKEEQLKEIYPNARKDDYYTKITL